LALGAKKKDINTDENIFRYSSSIFRVQLKFAFRIRPLTIYWLCH